MARHRLNRGLTRSRARHRKPGAVERMAHSVVISAAAVVLVMAMMVGDPGARS